MNKTLKWTLISTAALLAILFVGYKVMTSTDEEKASPEDKVVYEKAGLNLQVSYNRPSKRGREIFGGLVPYGKVWRTGANEATVFTTNKDITIEGKLLKAGKYTLWTIPEKDHWSVIFNSKMYPWAVNFDEQPLRESKFDALIVDVPVQENTSEVEQFTIKIEDQQNIQLWLMWDKTMVNIPIE